MTSPRAISHRLSGSANANAMIRLTATLDQKSASPSSVAIAPGTSRMNALSTTSITEIDAESEAGTTCSARPNVTPGRRTGASVSEYPKKNASVTARATEATSPQPNAVATTIPGTSPIAQPVRQCGRSR